MAADVVPLDPNTPVGRVRLTIGDTVATSGAFTYFSDDAITVALDLGNDSVLRAVSILVKQLALQMTLAGQSIRADDFAINTLGKGKDLLQVAATYMKDALLEELAEAREDFAIVNTRLNSSGASLGLECL